MCIYNELLSRKSNIILQNLFFNLKSLLYNLKSQLTCQRYPDITL